MRAPSVLLLLLMVCQTLAAEVYRWVDDEGRTHFSDRPAPAATPVPLSGHGPADSDPAADTAPASGAAVLGPYKAFEILSPEVNATLRPETESVPFNLLIDPPLLDSHRLSVVVDGSPIAVEAPNAAQLSLKGLGLGSHVAEAVINDPDGSLVARTPPVNFHLRKPLPPGVLE
jgi:hypothetical protein